MVDEEKKIIVDEGWKDQIEREKKEALEAGLGEFEGDDDPELGDFDGDAYFEALVGSLAAQAMLSLGLLVHEGIEGVEVSLDDAGHIIDTLKVLQEKTSGNLTDEEGEGLDLTIDELENAYIIRSQQAGNGSMENAGPTINIE